MYREKAEISEALLASEIKYRRLFEAAKDGILILDAQTGMVIDVNPFLIDLLGFTREHFLKQRVWELGFFKDVFANKDKFMELRQKGYVRYEHLPLETTEGRQIDVEFVSNVYPVGDFTVIQCNIRDITERKRAQDAIRDKTEELSHKNAELERFTYAASHDLKSPLVTVKTFMGYLEKDMAQGDTQRVEKDAQYIHSAVDKMGRLLDELLQMSRIGRVVNAPVRVTLHELVTEALNAVAGSLAARQVDVRADGENLILTGDRQRLAEIFQNLIDNAVKFMGDQSSPRIEIGTQGHGPDAVFFIRDNGVGIDPRYKEKVFGLFEKLDLNSDGTGLGLALVKRIVETYQGRIWVESNGEAGQGSCFRFTLPGAVRDPAQGEK